MLRNDLEIVQALAASVMDGATPDVILDEIGHLQTQSPLWQLKASCMYYCRFVHLHHTGEDIHIFPALRTSDPALNPVVDKLEADHRRVAEILHEVEGAARELRDADNSTSRGELRDALHRLAETLLVHLDYEEINISPTLRTWQSWPAFR